jgi:hypothetical protein
MVLNWLCTAVIQDDCFYYIVPFLSWRRSSHALPPLRAGLSTYLYLNKVPEASTELHLVHSLMIHGSGTEKIRFSFQLYCLPIILFQEMSFKLLFICKAINLLHIQILILKIICFFFNRSYYDG